MALRAPKLSRMEPLTRERLPEVIAEVDRLAEEKHGAIERADAEAVLAELGMPVDLLDEALAQIRARDAARLQARRRFLVGTVLIAAALGGGALFLHAASKHAASYAAVKTQHPRITLDPNDANGLASITRDGSKDVYFAVDLVNAPIGESLPLRCTWVDAAGHTDRENRFDTKTIDRATWPTHCKTRIPSEAKAGPWKVTMLLDDRAIADLTFEVR
jgi:hypothetical protein